MYPRKRNPKSSSMDPRVWSIDPRVWSLDPRKGNPKS